MRRWALGATDPELLDCLRSARDGETEQQRNQAWRELADHVSDGAFHDFEDRR